MKLVFKRASLVVLVLAIVCQMVQYVLCYWCGYYQKSFSPILWVELLALFGFILFLAALITWGVSLFQRKQRLWTTAVLVGLLSLWMLPSSHDLILHGMRDGMLRNYSLDDVRHFAHDIEHLSSSSVSLVAGERIFMHQDLDLAKIRLKEKYPFLTWCMCIAERTNVVSVEWGGFENHWGFTVAIDGKRIDPNPRNFWSPDHKTIRISDDIFLQSDY